MGMGNRQGSWPIGWTPGFLHPFAVDLDPLSCDRGMPVCHDELTEARFLIQSIRKVLGVFESSLNHNSRRSCHNMRARFCPNSTFDCRHIRSYMGSAAAEGTELCNAGNETSMARVVVLSKDMSLHARC